MPFWLKRYKTFFRQFQNKPYLVTFILTKISLGVCHLQLASVYSLVECLGEVAPVRQGLAPGKKAVIYCLLCSMLPFNAPINR